jgi:glycosyltransferase involved in cell wall biosynthesis
VTVRALLVAHDASRTGVPVGLLRLVEALSAGTDVQPSVLLLHDGPLAEPLRSSAPCVAVGPEHGRGPLDLVQLGLEEVRAAPGAAALRRLRVRRAAARLGRWDVLYLAGAAAFSSLEALGGSGPVLGHVHELEVGLERALPPAQRPLLGRADRYVATTPQVAGLLHEQVGVAPEHVHCIGEAVPDEVPVVVDPAPRLRARLGIPAGAPVVGALGALVPRKGPDLFLQVARHVAAVRTEVHLVWVGPGGADAAWLARDLQATGLADRVHLVEAQANPYDWLRLLDVLVVPSREDTQPLVALEAAQVGTPIVAFAQGGLPDLLGDGARGLLAPPLDAVALAAAALDVLDRPDAAAERAGRARRHVMDVHRASVVVPQVRDLLVRLASGTPQDTPR